MLGVALVGLGMWGEKLADALRTSGRFNLISVFARNEAKRRQFQNRYHCEASNSFEEILRDPRVDGIVLATPNRLHESQIIMAVESGKHVLVEKPVAATLEQACRIAAKVNNIPVIVAVGHNSRRLPENRLMKQWLLEGKIGDPVMIEAHLSSDTGFAIQPGDWRSAAAECASGPLIQLGIHHADTLQYLLGTIKTVSGFQKQTRLKTEIMDTAETLVEFENGCLGYIGDSYITPRTCRIVLYGTAGQIFYDDRLGLHLFSKEETKRIDLRPPDRQLRVNATLVEEVSDFADSILLGKPSEVSIFEGLRALAVVEAARLSQLWNRPVSVEELIHTIQ